ncbi:autotransporter assembly complex protein TamA [Hyphomicrobium sulfonivorans]|uniref:autotransporter assembly complex protein TamA n=1 Tax=Hyphomicrobium sulfonivorans TaxID=121290 RepID=UPI001571398E|nr:autotransporter assembly complex family protein [Hyphomicrobium sulfonivorans]MBI1649169.1 outer membrane protein assembly factor [Hyphomicrobium sulfonivorans]NSL70300.1 hypothetical protein [Hyphomicrobium sulfonivorans]
MLSAAVVLAQPEAAMALELFGVSILGDDAAPSGAFPYAVSLQVEGQAGQDEALAKALTPASILIEQSKQGASDALALVARARTDVERIVAALYAEARYGGDVQITIGGVPLAAIKPEELEQRAEGAPPVEVAINIRPGPVFLFGSVRIEHNPPTEAAPALDPQSFGLVQGEPAKSALIVAASDRIVEAWRSSGYPFAQITDKDIEADHARHVVDVRLMVAPGDPAVYGWVNVTGSVDLDSRRIAEQTAIRPGERFSPRQLKQSRERLRKFESIESVRVIEGDQVDDTGGIPITVEVIERKARFFGATVSASTVDGAEVQAYWGHRNLFGEGEKLRVDATVSQIGADGFERLQFDVGATFSKPGVLDIDTDFFSEIRLVRERPESYESLSGNVRFGLAHRFDSVLSGSMAFAATQSRIEDAFGTTNYTLLSLPGDLLYDSRNDRFDPSSGINAIFRFAPVVELASGATFGASELSFASYRSLDTEGRAILAGRFVIGSDFGASLADVPATYRFFAGGGGSVRGYEYRSLGPTFNGQVVGGLSMVGGSAELRWRIMDSLGLVPFVDVAVVSPDSFPTFNEPVYVGAGIGLRYYTSFGPLRLDFAIPTTHTEGQPKFGVYVGLGQSF